MRRRKKSGWGKKVAIGAGAFAGALLIGAALYAGSLIYKADQAIGQIAAPPPSGTENGTSGGEHTTDREQAGKPFSMMIAGVDHRAGSGGSMNADVMMLVALNPGSRTATVLSLPRDMQLKPGNISAQKANYYYAYYYNKDRDTAISNTRTFFSDLLQVPIDYMAVVDFDGFRQLVDALGGLQIDVDMDMRYIDNFDGTNINLKKGPQTLTGKETLDFVRYRKSNQGTAESSDLARNERQHQVLSQLLNKLTSFSGIAQWGDVLDIGGKSLKTDVPEATIREWISSFRKLKPDQIDFVSVDGRWESPYIVPDEEELKAALHALRVTLELPEERLKEAEEYRISQVVRVHSGNGTTVTGDTYRR